MISRFTRLVHGSQTSLLMRHSALYAKQVKQTPIKDPNETWHSWLKRYLGPTEYTNMHAAIYSRQELPEINQPDYKAYLDELFINIAMTVYSAEETRLPIIPYVRDMNLSAQKVESLNIQELLAKGNLLGRYLQQMANNAPEVKLQHQDTLLKLALKCLAIRSVNFAELPADEDKNQLSF